MDKQSVPTSENPKVTLKVNGDLVLKGWDENEIVAKVSNKNDLTIEHVDDQVNITCLDDCNVRMPAGAQVTITSSDGNAIIKALEGILTIQSVSGDLILRSVSETKVDKVHGNLVAKNIAGSLKLGIVNGNAKVRDIQEDFLVENIINGNLKLDDVDGDVMLNVNGNAAIRLDPSPGKTYRFVADGNILCRLPSDASAEVNIQQASKITIRAPGVELPSEIKAPYSFTIGDGDGKMEISANGEVYLVSQPSDWAIDDFEINVGEDFESMAETIGEQVSQQVEAHMEMLEQQIEAQMGNLSKVLSTSGLSPEQSERIAQRAKEASERAGIRAQEKMRRAQEKLERKLESARRRAEMKARAAERAARDRRRRPESVQWAPPPKTKAASEPVCDEERMMILQMLEQGKISIDEAEQLLSALEGK